MEQDFEAIRSLLLGHKDMALINVIINKTGVMEQDFEAIRSLVWRQVHVAVKECYVNRQE